MDLTDATMGKDSLHHHVRDMSRSTLARLGGEEEIDYSKCMGEAGPSTPSPPVDDVNLTYAACLKAYTKP